MIFRRDVQGLRALAIAPVVLFHAFPALVPGGYVGVDIFFVISGYLITGILLDELRAGDLSIAGFYARRVRRLFPALYLMLAAALAAGVWMLPPAELAALGKAALAAIFYVANLWFARSNVGYFADDSSLQPLLHLWSLGVEEQFYLVFPVLLYLVWRFARRGLPVILWIAGAASLACAVMLGGDGFFLPMARAYELIAGALIAAGAVPAIRVQWLRDAASIVGLAMIVASFALFSDQVAMPGWAALLPVAGAALVIAAGESLGGRLLGWAPFVLLGSISYSLYLWHWPILVYLRWLQLAPPTPLELAGGILLAIVVASASWRFVEQPILAGRWRVRTVLIAGAAAMLVAVALTGPLVATRGLPQRFSSAALTMLRGKTDVSPRRDACAGSVKRMVQCPLGGPVPPSVAVWGDSFSIELAAAMNEAALARGSSVLELTIVGCAPALGYQPGDRSACPKATHKAFKALRDDAGIRRVVLALNYAKYPAATRAQLLDGLERTAVALHAAGKRVVLLDPVPGVPFDAPDALAMTLARGGDPARYGWPRADYDRANAGIIARLDAIAAKVGAERIRPQAKLCTPSRCVGWLRDTGPLYFDDHHMTMAAARLVIAP